MKHSTCDASIKIQIFYSNNDSSKNQGSIKPVAQRPEASFQFHAEPVRILQSRPGGPGALIKMDLLN